MKRLLCRLLGHRYTIGVFNADGERIGSHCWRCLDWWPKP